jgi:hypothetical protein
MRFFGRLTHVVVPALMPVVPVAVRANEMVVTPSPAAKRRVQRTHKPQHDETLA